MKDSFETYVLLLPINSLSDGRKKLEFIVNKQFGSISAIKNSLCFDEFDPMNPDDLRIIPLIEFMEWLNDQDDDMPIDERFDPMKYWFGYVQINKI
jgi:hypothetical protein